MKNCNAPQNRNTRRILPIACAAALAVVSTVSLAHRAHADEITVPPLPPGIGMEVLPPNQVFFVGHGVGTQNYVCKPTASGVKYVLFTPEATLFDGDKQITTHYFSPNPDPHDPNVDPTVVADGAIRATWQDSKDGSIVWARADVVSTDAKFVKPGAVAWVKLTVVGTEDGAKGGDTLTKTTFIQRLNTSGGLPPPTGCSGPGDVGNTAFSQYEADYFFYANPEDSN